MLIPPEQSVGVFEIRIKEAGVCESFPPEADAPLAQSQ